MAERSSELDEIENRGTDETSQEIGLEIGAPTTYATTAINKDSDNTTKDDSTALATTGATEIDPNAEPDEIKAQIEQIRTNMSETINAIQDKLSVSNLVESAKDEVGEQISGAYESAKDAIFGATAGKMGSLMAKMRKNIDNFSEDYGPAISDAGRMAVQTAKSNPIPIALIGIGLGMWLINSRNKSHRVKSYRYTDDFDDEADYDYSDTELQNFVPSDRQSTVKKAYSKVSDVAGQASEAVTNAASTAYSGVTSAASSAYSGVGSVAEKAYDQVGNLGTGAKQAASWTQETYSQQIEENPLAVGAAAFVIGAIVGLSLPSTEFEGQYLGETRNNLVQKAQDAAGGLISQAQQVAGDITKTVKEEVKAQGFTA
ncbi:MAG: DUF3618 domain-containing protein [Pyrinomonadaceae bacterium]